MADNTGEAIFDAGIIASSSSMTTVCTRSVIENDKCSKFFDRELLKTYLAKNCVGQDHCKIENLSRYVQSDKAGFDADECNASES